MHVEFHFHLISFHCFLCGCSSHLHFSPNVTFILLSFHFLSHQQTSITLNIFLRNIYISRSKEAKIVVVVVIVQSFVLVT